MAETREEAILRLAGDKGFASLTQEQKDTLPGSSVAPIVPPTPVVPGDVPIVPDDVPVAPEARKVKFDEDGEPTDLPETVIESEEDIQARKRASAQSEIDAITRAQDLILEKELEIQRELNIKRERGGAAISTLTGLAGSTEATFKSEERAEKAGQAITKVTERREAIKAAQIQGILSDVRESAEEESRFQREEARLGRIEEREVTEERRTRSVQNAQFLAASGATLEGYKVTDPEGFEFLAKQVGGEEILNGIFTLNRPAESILDSKIVNGQYIITYQNPLDSSTRIETLDLGLPDNYTKAPVDAGDRLLAIPDDWGGDPADLITINKGLAPKDVEEKKEKGEVSDLTKGILANIASLKDLTPSGREEVIAEIYRSGRGGELSNKMDEYATQKADSVIPAIDKALSQIKEAGTGFFGSQAAKIPGTDSFRLQSTLDTIFANIAFGELTAMRAASPTGGALGQVSERELALLGSVQASLKMGIGDELMIENLNKVKKVFEDIKSRADSGDQAGILTSPDGTQEVNIADLTPEQVQEAKDNGWQ